MRYLLLLSLLLSSLLTGCEVAPWREHARPWTGATMAGADDVRVLLREGGKHQLARPRIEVDRAGAVLVGTTELGSELRIALGRIVRLETRRTETLPVVANAVAFTAVVAVVVAAIVCSGQLPGSLVPSFSFGSGGSARTPAATAPPKARVRDQRGATPAGR